MDLGEDMCILRADVLNGLTVSAEEVHSHNQVTVI